MSLDVYLTVKGPVESLPRQRIFVREDGASRELSREEWDARYPGQEPFYVQENVNAQEVYWGNITHNLNKMAQVAGLYEVLWRPEELGIVRAEQLITILRVGLERLQDDPERYREYNPSNGWGSYELFVQFVDEYLRACEEWPDAEVYVSR